MESWIPVLKESGLAGVSSRTYHDGERLAHMELYTFRDSSGAYEAYTFLLDAESPIKMFHVTIPRSNQVLNIWSESAFAAEALKAAAAWEQSISDGVPSPPVAAYLPEKDKEHLTERYALGPIAFGGAANALAGGDVALLVDQVGFNSGAEVMSARYKSDANEAVLLLIEYPTPQLAEQHLRHLETALSPTAKQAGATIERKGSLLSLVLKPSSAAYADALRSAVNYETQVTWNEPTHKITDPPWLTIVGKIIVFTMMFMGIAMALGVAFGGVRVLAKIFFPGKVFDRPDQMDVLQLGLSGKRIDSRDFY
jgi:hypothetical protein